MCSCIARFKLAGGKSSALTRADAEAQSSHTYTKFAVRLCSRQPSYGDSQVEQIGEAKVLFKSREFTTLLKVDEDARNPEELRTAFTLIRSVSPCTCTFSSRTPI